MMFAAYLLLLLAQSPSFEAALRAGLEALQNNDLAGALVSLESAAKMQPDQPQVWLALAQTYWKLHDSKLAGSAADPIALKALSFFIPRAAITKRRQSALPGMRRRQTTIRACMRTPSSLPAGRET